MTEPSAGQNGRRDGFSLVEVLVVLAVVGLVFSIAIPSFRSLNRPSAKAIARSVLQAAQLARLAALKAREERELRIDAKAGVIEAEMRGTRIEVPAGIAFVATIGASEATAMRGAIRFYPDGAATGGVLRFTDERGVTAAVTVSWITGVATLDEGEQDGRR
jgi:general secretion pathway protein H